MLIVLKILRGKNVYKTLAEMHRLRFLDSYIPEFEEISCRVQHDLYHVYTVDQHQLYAVAMLKRIARGELAALVARLDDDGPDAAARAVDLCGS